MAITKEQEDSLHHLGVLLHSAKNNENMDFLVSINLDNMKKKNVVQTILSIENFKTDFPNLTSLLEDYDDPNSLNAILNDTIFNFRPNDEPFYPAEYKFIEAVNNTANFSLPKDLKAPEVKAKQDGEGHKKESLVTKMFHRMTHRDKEEKTPAAAMENKSPGEDIQKTSKNTFRTRN